MLRSPAPRPRRAPAAASLLAVVAPDTTYSILALTGELDLSTAPLLARLVEQQIATGHLDVRVDLSELAFCDVRGMRALLAGRRRLAAVGGELTLLHARPVLLRTASLAGFAAELGLSGELAPARAPSA